MELFAYKDYRGLFVVDHDRQNPSQTVHQEIDEDPWLNLFKKYNMLIIVIDLFI
jgi:hypothetical protein